MAKRQIIILIVTLAVILLAYWYYFTLKTICGAESPLIIVANPTFPGMYMQCGWFDIYAFILTTLQSFTGWRYSFMSDVLPLILWLPIALIGLLLAYIIREK